MMSFYDVNLECGLTTSRTGLPDITAGIVKIVSLYYSMKNIYIRSCVHAKININSPERFPEPTSDWMRKTEEGK